MGTESGKPAREISSSTPHNSFYENDFDLEFVLLGEGVDLGIPQETINV